MFFITVNQLIVYSLLFKPQKKVSVHKHRILEWIVFIGLALFHILLKTLLLVQFSEYITIKAWIINSKVINLIIYMHLSPKRLNDRARIKILPSFSSIKPPIYFCVFQDFDNRRKLSKKATQTICIPNKSSCRM